MFCSKSRVCFIIALLFSCTKIAFTKTARLTTPEGFSSVETIQIAKQLRAALTACGDPVSAAVAEREQRCIQQVGNAKRALAALVPDLPELPPPPRDRGVYLLIRCRICWAAVEGWGWNAADAYDTNLICDPCINQLSGLSRPAPATTRRSRAYWELASRLLRRKH